MRSLALIPARGGSTRVPGKNLALLGGRTLVRRALDTALAAGCFDAVALSSDDDAILAEARDLPEVHVLRRPPELATTEARSYEVLVHALHELEGQPFEAAAIVQCTSPFTAPEDLAGTLALLERSGADAAVSVARVEASEHPLKLKRMEGDRLVPYLADDALTPAQELPPLWRRNGSVYASRRATIDAGALLGDDVRGYEMPAERSFDVDTPRDLAFARFLVERGGGGVILAMTMVVRDESDVIEATLRYHLHQGVDVVLVSDHASSDGTREILEDYAREGFVRVIDRPGGDFPAGRRVIQGEWQTEMARLAAVEHGADWVINSDADEFWWPVLGTLKDTFAEVPERFGILTAPRPDFVPRPDGPGTFVERMTVRQALSDRRVKRAHRGRADVEVGIGSHDVRGADLDPAPWFPARILHFPMRDTAQYEKRMRFRAAGLAVSGKNQEWWDAYREGRVAELYASKALDGAALEAALADGRVVEDARLREFLAACPDPLVDRSALPPAEPRRRPEPGAIRPAWLAEPALQDELAEVQLDALMAMERRVHDLEGDRARARARLRRRQEKAGKLKAENAQRSTINVFEDAAGHFYVTL